MSGQRNSTGKQSRRELYLSMSDEEFERYLDRKVEFAINNMGLEHLAADREILKEKKKLFRSQRAEWLAELKEKDFSHETTLVSEPSSHKKTPTD